MSSLGVVRSSFAEKQTMKQRTFGFIAQFTVCGDDVIILSCTASLSRMPRPYNKLLAENKRSNHCGVAIGWLWGRWNIGRASTSTDFAVYDCTTNLSEISKHLDTVIGKWTCCKLFWVQPTPQTRLLSLSSLLVFCCCCKCRVVVIGGDSSSIILLFASADVVVVIIDCPPRASLSSS